MAEALTIADALKLAASLPGDTPRLDAEVLLSDVLQRDRAYLYTWPDKCLNHDDASRYLALIDRRKQGEPVAYLTGKREFWGLEFMVTDAVLIPRADTETLVEAALTFYPADDPIRVLDWGTGSGAIALALASERPEWKITGIDQSRAAVEVARSNGQELGFPGVSFDVGSWFVGVGSGTFELIVANPPYIDCDDPHLTCGDLPYEPITALVAGESGFSDLNAIAEDALTRLTPNGWLMMEHGYQQGPRVRNLLQDLGFASVQSLNDLAGQERVTCGQLPISKRDA